MQVAYSGKKVERKEIFEIWDTTRTPRAVFLFLEIFEKAITFATGSCQNSNRKFWLNGKRPQGARTSGFEENAQCPGLNE